MELRQPRLTPERETMIEVSKVIASRQPYPRNGNFTTQKPKYDWTLKVDGKWMGTFSTKREAVEAAKDYQR